MAAKKNRLLKLFACISSALVLACGGYFVGMHAQTESVISALPRIDHDKIDKDVGFNIDENPIDIENDKTEFIEKSSVSKASEGTWSTVDSCNYDITGDGINDTITLYTSAQSDDKGILWSEAQEWILEVSDGVSGCYTLDNETLRNGSMYYNVMERESGERVIVVYKSTGTGTIIDEYVFSNTGFNMSEIYNSQSVNSVHSSIPWYK